MRETLRQGLCALSTRKRGLIDELAMAGDLAAALAARLKDETRRV
jgi:hypothetical protein